MSIKRGQRSRIEPRLHTYKHYCKYRYKPQKGIDLKAVFIVLLGVLAIELALISLILYTKDNPSFDEVPTLVVSDKGTDGLFTVDGQKYVIVRGEIYERHRYLRP